jgi:hypothetical protein
LSIHLRGAEAYDPEDLIECGPYATGANFSGFRGYLPQLVDLPFGIAEILPNGECFITKPEGTSGTVNKYNITAQLLYELQGELYLNPDVVADISKVSIENTLELDRVFVSGIKGYPPPSTTKAMLAATGGYQCETTFYINGLDVKEKAEMMKTQLKYMFKDSNFSKLSIELYGAPASDPKSQQEGTCFLRVFVQARNLADVSATKFKDIVYALRMQSYPGNASLVIVIMRMKLTQNRLPHEPRFPNHGSEAIHGNLPFYHPSFCHQPPSCDWIKSHRHPSTGHDCTILHCQTII